MIRRVVVRPNGNVTVFDEKGEEVLEYRGRVVDALPKVLADAPDDTRWLIGDWWTGILRSDRAKMESLLAARQAKEGGTEG